MEQIEREQRVEKDAPPWRGFGMFWADSSRGGRYWSMADFRLSVLDQTPVPQGFSPGQALRNSIDLAQHCDRLGYHRYWVAEHHNSGALAGSSPEILIGHIAENTDTIRVGSGGVMLTHYSPLKVAENFAVLQALHPGRIDLGIGRAPGSDRRTMAALARGGTSLDLSYCPSMVDELRNFVHDDIARSPVAGIAARPVNLVPAEIWVLASSQDSAAIAADLGLPLSWAHFINADGPPICRAYREQFVPSAAVPEPRLSIGVSVLCAETDQEARDLMLSGRLWRKRGLQGPFPSVEEARSVPGLADEPDDFGGRANPTLVGTPVAIKERLDAVVADDGAEEAVVVTITHDHRARVRSYELLAEAYGLGPAG